MLDLLIVGAGPSGIAAAVEAKRGGLKKVLVLEKGSSHSQMIRTYYKEGKRVDARYAGQQAICFGLLCLKDGDRESYMALMDHVIAQNQIEIRYASEVWSIQPSSKGLKVCLQGGLEIQSQCVLVAIGRMGKPNQPDYYKSVPSELKAAKRLLFDITSTPLHQQKVLVVGGGDSAAEYCDILSKHNRVTLSYRRKSFDKMNAMNLKILDELMTQKKICAYLGSNIVQIEADSEGLPRVIFAEGGPLPESFDHVVYALGGLSPVEFLRNSGVAVNNQGEPQLDSGCYESQVSGLYLSGDLLGKGQGGGSIIAGFNSATAAVRDMLLKHFNFKLEAEFVELEHLKF